MYVPYYYVMRLSVVNGGGWNKGIRMLAWTNHGIGAVKSACDQVPARKQSLGKLRCLPALSSRV